MEDKELQESLQYLLITPEEKIKFSAIPFDAKVQCWISDDKEGFVTADIQDTKGDDVTVKTSKGETVTVKKDKIMEMNPPKYNQCEDMANLTYLNEATVFGNLAARYMTWKIYTYSGLFCITINPFKRLPVYTYKVMGYYRGKKRNEVPPHLYSIADNAYQNMLRDRENQSMLITGESGAGKTENTKKVIQYLASVAAADKPKDYVPSDNEVGLEEQIVAANPVLEAYGNAKTVRNNNSSRFGKFIRIHFGPSGKIAGADIESYLLEKSRIVYQQPIERNYHIFYQLLAKNYPKYHADLLVEPEPGLYFFINQGMLAIDRVDDGAEMKACDEAFDCLGFTQQEKMDLFKNTGAILHWGNAQFKQKPKEEQAECDGTSELEKVSHLFGVESADLMKGLLKPRIKVGNEFVNKGQNKEQVINSCGALSKSLFARMFAWLVEKVNETLNAKTKRQYFIGVLDIAGFEIFDFNTFEQLAINYTNERLQQFFNHHMFVLEQEEYKKEGIVWEMMNFGMDLQACIDLIEKPMGILSILEEECIVPKASDKTFVDKLYAQHLGKHPAFGKPKPQKGKVEAHFELHHYAGTVAYNICDWLNKNKDPINQTVALLLKKSKGNKLLNVVFADVEEQDGDKKAGGGGKGKKGPQTLSATHRDQLNKLMATLKATSPHFVRCIIPNEIKTGGILDSHLVMHQLTCNGVLEGIRICRKGFPNRTLYQEFKQRYSILAPNVIPKGFVDATKASGDILKEIKLDQELYRLGNTKVFFKAGVLGQLEELREEAVGKIISKLQAHVRLFCIKKMYKTMLEQKLATSVLQRNIKKYLDLKNWQWFKLLAKVKPLLSNSRMEEEAKAKEEEMRKQMELLAQNSAGKAELETKVAKLEAEKQDLLRDLEAERAAAGSVGETVQNLTLQKTELETQLQEALGRIEESENASSTLESKKRKVEQELNDVKKEKDDLQTRITKLESDLRQKDTQIHQFQDEMAHQDESIAKVTKDKKKSEENNQKLTEELQQEQDKVNNLNKLKVKLEQQLDELEDNLEREKKGRADLDKVKRKLESDLKATQAAVEELEQIRRDLEDNLKKRNQDISGLNARIEEDNAQIGTLNKKLKEVQAKLQQAEDDIEVERQARLKVEKQRADLARELDEVNEKLEEATGASTAHAELNKKREAELAKLRKDLEEANLQHEAVAAQLKKKQQDTVTEMSEQIEQLQKLKNKLEKEKQQAKAESDELALRVDNVNKGKAAAEKVTKQLEAQLQEFQLKIDEAQRQQSDLSSQKSKLQQENGNLLRQIEEFESQISGFARVKQQLVGQIEEAKRATEDEQRSKQSLVLQVRNLNTDLEQAKSALDDEQIAKSELQKQLGKLSHEVQHWKSKYETEGMARAEELEEAKKKLVAKLAEAEEQVETALAKCNNLEKLKQKLQTEVDDLTVNFEQAQTNAVALEKKQKQLDKLIVEWKAKCESLTSDLESSQKDSRQLSAELFRFKAQNNELNEKVETEKRNAKHLSDEIRDLNDQLAESARSIHEAEKAKKRIEMEKDELQSAVEAAANALRAEEAKVVRAQVENGQLRQENDRKLHEKDEEIENVKRTNAKLLESMRASMEGETKAKNEAIRQKKKLESDLNEVEVKLDGVNRSYAEAQKQIKKLAQQVTESQSQVESEQRSAAEAREQVMNAERRVLQSASEIDDLKTALEQADKAKKSVENELRQATDQIGELSVAVSSLTALKRKLENDAQVYASEVEDASNEVKKTEEKLRKALLDNSALTDNLRREQVNKKFKSFNFSKIRKNFYFLFLN
jgi:myosin heavy chain 6/7